MDLRFSIVVPVYNNPADLKTCVESLKALDYPAQDYEIIVVDNNSTDDTAVVARQLGVICLSETRFQSSYAARNTGIRAAKGAFIAFTDSDCVADKGWLKAFDAVCDDEAAGCFAGEILSVPPTTTVERFSDSIGLLRQKGPLSGWHFKPYAQTANAVYRKSVFDRIGLFDPTTNSGGDAAIAWRMLDKTSYTIRFVPEAIAYHHHRTSVPDLYAQFRRYGVADGYWARSDPEYQPPAIATLESDFIALSTKHLTAMETANVDEDILFSGLDLVARAARMTGYLGFKAEGASSEGLSSIERRPFCNICENASFEADPNGRLFKGKAPRCCSCGSLERHRMLFGYFAQKWENLGKIAALCVGQELPKMANARFSSYRHREAIGEPKYPIYADYDVLFSINQMREMTTEEIGDWLERMVPALKDTGTLLLLETDSKLDISELSADISKFLPAVQTSTNVLCDPVTGDTAILLVAEAESSRIHSPRIRVS